MNIVFDLGGVVLTWKPEKIIADVFADPETRRRARAGIFEHPDWLELDRGTLPLQQAIRRASARSGITADKIAKLFDLVPRSLKLIPDTIDLLYRLKKQGQRLFYLSNMHSASIQYLEKEYGFWDVFDGGIISCRVQLIKPEPAIYSALLEQYALESGETVFIDDTEINLTAAAEFGIRTIHFLGARQCAEKLRGQIHPF